MRKKGLQRIVAAALVLSMLPGTVSAAGWGSSVSSSRGWLESLILSLWNRVTGDEEAETDAEMTVVTDRDTVEHGEMLRATTYDLSVGETARAASTTTLKYFPVTLYDYDTEVINAATHEADLEADADLTQWQGIYFSNGQPDENLVGYTRVDSAVAYSGLTWAEVQNGTYYSSESCTTQAKVTEVTQKTEGYEEVTVTYNALLNSNSSSWKKTSYYYQSGENYYPLYVKRSGYYSYTYTFGYGTSDSNVTTIGTENTQYPYYSNPKIKIYEYGTVNETIGYTLTAGSQTLANSDGTDTSKKVGVTLYKKGEETDYSSIKTYAGWNWWNKVGNNGMNVNGQKFYTGLAESQLDSSKNMVFTKPDGGIFNSDATVKHIYSNVELPFVYENGTYTFDASENGVYFHEDATQKSSGTAASNTRLYFNEGNTQSNSAKYADGSETVWAPFNDGTSFSESAMNYHFGMRATVPFSMTANGRMNESDNQSEKITFSFSGDDDVWVFIDGKLVIDLGGIHNRLDATINFADNTVTYSESNSVSTATGSYNDSGFRTTQTLFNSGSMTGLLGTDRTSFAASANHELTIFYLERGKGSSNSKIAFNLPMKDTVTVTKRVNRSYTKTADGTEIYSPLTAAEQARVNNIDFGFTLYQCEVDSEACVPLANRTYYLLNSSNQVIATPSTDATGRFTLKNGQSARFVGDIGDGMDFQVVEDSVAAIGFVTPDYSYGGEAANGFVVDDVTYAKGDLIPTCVVDLEAETNESDLVTVKGSDESEDSLVFVCENFLNADMPNPSARPVDDQIVLDYGLNVEIDVLNNDVYRGESIELLTTVSGDGMTVDAETGMVTAEGAALKYGTAAVEDGKIVYHLTSQLTGVEVLNYLVMVSGSNSHDYAVGKVYIIPATSIYYEENFGLVTYTGSAWQDVVDASYINTFQEPGVVGDHTDSPYGSDVAYRNDSEDSNGTSKYADTTSSAVKFEYTFTGTGTSFFARTSNNSGYLRITVKSEDGLEVNSLYRDTYYQSDVDTTLYNIPVYTIDELEYGTYTVTVLVAKANERVGYHKDFWLDGIRVFEPMNPEDPHAAVAASAYAADGEANMNNVTLRNKLLSTADYTDGELQWSENFVLFTDTDGEMTSAQDYQSKGPKEEVYLNVGQSITFSLMGWDANSNKIYLGMKAPFGSAEVQVGSTTMTLANAADCYYDISDRAVITTEADGTRIATFTIKATDGLVSLTNIKVTGNVIFPIVPNVDNDLNGGAGEGSDNDVEIDRNKQTEEIRNGEEW